MTKSSPFKKKHSGGERHASSSTQNKFYSGESGNWRRGTNDRASNNRPFRSSWHEVISIDEVVKNGINERDLLSMIENLNKISYPDPLFDEGYCMRVLVLLCEHIHQDLIASKYCQLVIVLIGQQKMNVAKWEESSKLKLVQFFTDLIERSRGWFLVDALRSLSYIVSLPDFELPNQSWINLLKVLLPNAELSVDDLNIKHYTLSCIDRLCTKSKLLSLYSQQIYDILFANLQQLSTQILKDASVEKHLAIVLKAISTVVTKSEEKTHVPSISKLIAVLKKLMFYGTTFVPAAPQSKKDVYFTSESDQSDSSDANVGSRSAIRIRLQIFQLLIDLAKKDLKAAFGEWKNLIPDTDSTNPQPRVDPTLCTAILYDRSPRCRSAAVQALIALVENSKLYLAQAEDTQTKSAFVPFSRVLAFMIREMHITLYTALVQEKSSPTQLYLLKALSVLTANTTYDRLSARELLSEKIIPSLLSMLESERNIQSSVFHCIASVFSTAKPLKNIETDSQLTSKTMETLLSYLEAPHSIIVRGECAQVVASIAKNYPSIIEKYWSRICLTVHRGLSYADQTYRLLLVQIMNSYTAPFTETIYFNSNSMTNEQVPSSKLVKPIPKEIWIQIIDEVASIAINDEFQSIRAVACNIYSNLSEGSYEELSASYTQDIIDKLLECVEDSQAPVRSSACKALGIFASFNKLRATNCFAQLLYPHLRVLLSETALNTRVRASWTLANICDALRYSDWCKTLTPDDESNTQLFINFALLSLNTCNDNDKVLSNSVRALGNIGYAAPQPILQAQLTYNKITKQYSFQRDNIGDSEQVTLENAVAKELIACIGSNASVKPRWNSCYALGNLLQNTCTSSSILRALECLCDLIVSDKNFKVRIQAALALSMVEDYGQNYKVVLQALLNPLLKSDASFQYKEYKYVQTLKQQVEKTICHLLVAIPESCMNQIADMLMDNASLIANVLVDSLNQQSIYDQGLIALRKVLVLFEHEFPAMAPSKRKSMVDKALQTLKKKEEFEKQIQANLPPQIN